MIPQADRVVKRRSEIVNLTPCAQDTGQSENITALARSVMSQVASVITNHASEDCSGEYE